jgi:hypothetical protein
MMPVLTQSTGNDGNTTSVSHPKSQCERILAYLQEGKTLTGMDALNLFGCWALAQRVKNLRDAGHAVKTRMVKTPSGKHVAEYSLEGSSQ